VLDGQHHRLHKLLQERKQHGTGMVSR
jgi:hypothetical protein